MNFTLFCIAIFQMAIIIVVIYLIGILDIIHHKQLLIFKKLKENEENNKPHRID